MSTRPICLVITIATACMVSCASRIDMPQGSSAGYTSARLVKKDPKRPATTDATELQVHRLIQKSLANQFSAAGLSYGKSDSDLTVAYLVIYQEPGMTARYEDYFGYGRDADQIADVAHTRGALENPRSDYFQQAGILIDIIDSRTHKLIHRSLAKGDVVRGASESARAARIDAAIQQALAPFFRK